MRIEDLKKQIKINKILKEKREQEPKEQDDKKPINIPLVYPTYLQRRANCLPKKVTISCRIPVSDYKFIKSKTNNVSGLMSAVVLKYYKIVIQQLEKKNESKEN